MNIQKLRSYTTPILDLTDEELSLLMSCVASQKFKKGDMLLKAGEVCRAFYLVEKGYLRTWFDKDGAAINLNFTFERDFACNIKSFMGRIPSEINIEAGEDSVMWIFNLKSVRQQFGDNPQIMRFIRRLAIRLLLASEEYSNLFKISTPTERYPLY